MIDSKDKEQIVAMANAGIPYKSIARRFGYSESYVGKVALESGVRRNKFRYREKPVDYESLGSRSDTAGFRKTFAEEWTAITELIRRLG